MLFIILAGYIIMIKRFVFSLLAEAERPWTRTEQSALEAALRANPAKPGEPPAVRWQKIANVVGTRTMKECLQRYKYIAEQVSTSEILLPVITRVNVQGTLQTLIMRKHLNNSLDFDFCSSAYLLGNEVS